jgi:pSer/pThr/pTyr-binding forkhead associated (FHA) protein
MGKLLISKDGFKVREVELKSGTLRIGRAADNDIQLNDPTVSAHHAKIVSVMSNSYIEDLDSKNGIFINGERIVVQALEEDDVISIGQHELFFHESQDECVVQNRSINDAALVASANVAKSSVAREVSATTAIPRQNDIQQIIPSTPENSLRIVVDNTFKSLQHRPLDIDVSFEKFVNKSVTVATTTEALQSNGENVARNQYIKTHRFFESPAINTENDRHLEPDAVSKVEFFTERESAEHPRQQVQPAEVRQAVEVVEDTPVAQVEAPAEPKKIISRQPFMPSEEVVNHLIALSRERNKARHKPRGLVSLITVITFGLIAAAIYYQLQM